MPVMRFIDLLRVRFHRWRLKIAYALLKRFFFHGPGPTEGPDRCLYCGAEPCDTHACWRARLIVAIQGRYTLRDCPLCDRLHRAESTRDWIKCPVFGGWTPTIRVVWAAGPKR